MKKILPLFPLLALLIFLSSCSTTFAGTVFVVTFRDILFYVVLAFIFALFISFKSENHKRTFWIWFILNLLITPLCGFIYLLVIISRKV